MHQTVTMSPASFIIVILVDVRHVNSLVVNCLSHVNIAALRRVTLQFGGDNRCLLMSACSCQSVDTLYKHVKSWLHYRQLKIKQHLKTIIMQSY